MTVQTGDVRRLTVEVVSPFSGLGWDCRGSDGTRIIASTACLEAAELLPRKLAVGDRVQSRNDPDWQGTLKYIDPDGWTAVLWHNGEGRGMPLLSDLRLADPRTGERE